MINVGIGFSSQRDPRRAAGEIIQQAKAKIGERKINLAFLFGTIEFSHLGINQIVSELLGEEINIIGCSSAAVISNEGILRNGLGIMLLSLPEDIHIHTAYVKEIGIKSTLQAGEELAQNLLYQKEGMRRNLGLIFCDGLIQDEANFISGLQERLGLSFPLVGGWASDNLSFLKTFLYFKQITFNNAACGVIFGGRLNFGLGIKHGWKPLGKPRYVTRSFRNIIYEIDNLPAVQIYQDYLASHITQLKKDLRRISVLYPIGIYLPGEDEYLLRNLISIEENGALVLQGNIPQGSQIRLMIGTKESALEATKVAVEEAKKGLSNQTANFALIFTSVSRYIFLGRYAVQELEIIKKSLGKDTPLLGIYTYGEAAPLKAIGYHGKAYFHNQTITILVLRGMD